MMRGAFITGLACAFVPAVAGRKVCDTPLTTAPDVAMEIVEPETMMAGPPAEAVCPPRVKTGAACGFCWMAVYAEPPTLRT